MVRKRLITLITSMLLSMSVWADVAVIVNKANDSNIDKAAVQRMFMGKDDSFSNGQKALPVNIENTVINDEFNNDIIGRSTSQVSAYWSRLIFTGRATPPEVLKDEQAVVDAVKANPNAIGYVSAQFLAQQADDIRIIPL